MRRSEVLTGIMSVLIIVKSRPIEDLESRPQDELLGGIKRRGAFCDVVGDGLGYFCSTEHSVTIILINRASFTCETGTEPAMCSRSAFLKLNLFYFFFSLLDSSPRSGSIASWLRTQGRPPGFETHPTLPTEVTSGTFVPSSFPQLSCL